MWDIKQKAKKTNSDADNSAVATRGGGGEGWMNRERGVKYTVMEGD